MKNLMKIDDFQLNSLKIA